MKISSSFSSLMRTVVACKIEVVRNLNPSTESRLIRKVAHTRELLRKLDSLIMGSRLMQTVTCESGRCMLGLHVGTKNVAGSLFDPASIAVVSVWTMLNKEEGDISRLASQLQHIIEQHNVCRVVVGPWPRSMNEEQAENDLIVGAAKIGLFMGDLHNTGILKDDVDYAYYGVRVVLNESVVKGRVRELKLEGRKEFSGDETNLFEEFSDRYASQLMLMHYLEMAGDVAFEASSRIEISFPGDKSGFITAKLNEGLLTYYLSGAISGGCLCKVFPAGPPPEC
ncbi:hypothetical protein EZV62_005016 [Acer yangbiense]|uniref:Uncharacterized protein n=1 Tax=Acer yangbiense TaxID=1000413 RepID=A0A5C7ILJ6_9ROSI|nr:hypothetical protein EZV62_005016 [Acer yangbiense]